MENQITTNIATPAPTETTDDNRELNYWSNEFGIAKEELLAVIKRGGSFASAVEKHVRMGNFAV
jgi:hypothetical protein